MDAAGLGTVISGAVVVGGFAMYVIRAEMRGDVTRLDGRINTHEAACAERQKRMDERHEEVAKKLDAIDGKLDRLVGQV